MKILYVVTNLVNGKRYIGITVDFERRRKEHIAGKGSLLVYRAIQKYNLNNIEFDPLVEGPDKWIENFEIRMIASLETFGPKGYNLTAGGEGGSLGRVVSKETKQKLSEALQGIKRGPHSLEHKEKISESHRGKVLSKETKQKMSVAHEGKVFSKETRRKISEASKGRTFSKETRKKLSESQKGSNSYGTNPNAVIIIINGIKYDCIKEAVEILRVSRSTLDRARKEADSNTFSFQPKGVLTPLTSQ